ncbi:MAG TPA: protein kinase [Thermoanaerobaculia bacterium]|nr:protein kinase [Thermoanaerobaculia bacterium]
MGEVWRGRDTRLDRSVAIKILPSDLQANRELKLRLDREAKAISQLNHPHICTLYDVGHDDGTDYLVMELLEGETLAERIARGPLPLADVVRFGAQIAEALAVAHRSGVVHRDLKPGNIMLTRTGAKLLDFGLAKNAPVSNSSDALTARDPITEHGVVLGTYQYMAPEQLEGLYVDARADIFALGAVLYEMATGRRAFTGGSRTSVIVAIVSADPKPMSEILAVTPAALEELVRTCLAKDPEERMQNAHDVALALRAIGSAPMTTTQSRLPLPSKRAWIGWAAALLFAIAFVIAIVMYVRSRPAPPLPVRFTIAPPAGTNIQRTAAVSPDGRRIVFRAVDIDGNASLWMRSVDSLDAKPLAGTENATFAFWSADGRHIGFIARSRLRRYDTADGSVRTIVERVEGASTGAAWNRDDVIVFSSEGPLFRVAAAGGEPVALTKLSAHETFHGWPSFLPDGKHFLYVSGGAGGSGGIYVASLDGGERKRILPLQRLYELTPVFYASGHIFYLRKNALVAQPFDADDLELRGSAMTIDEDLELSGAGRTPLSVSASGTIVYRRAGVPVIAQLTFVDATGQPLAVVGDAGPFLHARLSPDAKRILVTREDSVSAVWMIDVERGTSTRRTFEEWSGWPAWQSDGKSFAYSIIADSPPNVFISHPRQEPQRLTTSTLAQYPMSFSPDGSLLVITTGSDLYTVATAAPHKLTPLLHSQFRETDGAVSPDGRWLAYSSNQSGQRQIYVTTFPQAGPQWQISTALAEKPRWSADGRELYWYDEPHKQLFAAKIEVADDEIRASIPRAMFPMASGIYDAAADGRFLIAKPSLNPSAPPLTVVVNWAPR